MEAIMYPEVLYYGKRITASGHQPVYKKLLPDGIPTELSPEPSLKLCDHSLDGFDWGRNGSAPAQLSLALLLDATTVPDTALAYYQEFKEEKVAWWKQEWSITRSEILLWIFERQKEQLETMVNRN